jgi:hypothetical protein
MPRLGTNRLMTCGGGKTSRGVHTLDECGSWAGRYSWPSSATTVHADVQWYGSHAGRPSCVGWSYTLSAMLRPRPNRCTVTELRYSLAGSGFPGFREISEVSSRPHAKIAAERCKDRPTLSICLRTWVFAAAASQSHVCLPNCVQVDLLR